jgi:WD40 repeat protein
VTAGRDARVFDTASGKRIHTLKGHVGPVITAGYSPDGTKIVTGGADRTVRIWDSTTFDQLGAIDGFANEPLAAKLDWKTRRLLVQTLFDTTKIVECTPCLEADELAELARQNVTRDLTQQELKDAGLTG